MARGTIVSPWIERHAQWTGLQPTRVVRLWRCGSVEGWLEWAVVLDLYLRRIIGWLVVIIFNQVPSGLSVTSNPHPLANSIMSRLASENAITKLIAPLTSESAQAASNSHPGFSVMLKEIETHGPPGVHRHLSEFRDYSWWPLNSFVHGGIHAVSRHRDGYPLGLLEQAVRQSNNLVHMSAMALAIRLERADLTMSVVALHRDYADCLQLKA